jgi:hypothetical protein
MIAYFIHSRALEGRLLAQAVPSRSLTVEVILVVIMVGVALFAVCRSSRRN